MTFFSKKHAIAAIIGFILASSIATSSSRAENLPYAKAVSALKNFRYDSSFYYLQTAAAAGLPDDSLYYLWAQIYLEQGTLDTALALNLAAARTGSQTLHKPLIEQKYLIYETLGWADEARALIDSLSQLKKRGSRLIPRLSLEQWLGRNNRRLIDGQPYPFIAEGTTRNIQNPGIDLTAKSEWFIPAGKTMFFVPAFYYNFANGLEQTERRFDSLNHSLGFSVGLRNFLPHLAFDYSLLRQINLFDDLSTRHQFSLSRSVQGNTWQSFNSLLYTIEKPDIGAVAYQCFWLMNYMSRPISANTTFFMMPLISLFLAEAVSTSYTTSLMFIENPAGSPVVHYTDSTFTQPIPVPSPLTMFTQMQLIEAYRTASVRRSFFQYAPESYCSATPAFGLTRSFPFDISLEGTLKGMANYYLQEYEWTTYAIPYSAAYYDRGSWLAYSRSDGNYYLVTELGNIVNAEKYSGPVSVTSVKKRRIDGYLAGELEVEKRFGKLGTLGINGYARKHWSTLQDCSPVTQKDFVYGFGAFLKVKIGAPLPLKAL